MKRLVIAVIAAISVLAQDTTPTISYKLVACSPTLIQFSFPTGTKELLDFHFTDSLSNKYGKVVGIAYWDDAIKVTPHKPKDFNTIELLIGLKKSIQIDVEKFFSDSDKKAVENKAGAQTCKPPPAPEKDLDDK